MKTTITALAIIGLTFAGDSVAGEKSRKTDSAGKEQKLPAPSAKPVLEQEVNGVKFAIFQTDLQGRPSRDRAWLLVSNFNPRPVTVTGSVKHDFQTTFAGAPKGDAGVTMTISEPFAQVVEGDSKIMLWFCDRTKAVGTTIRLESGKAERIADLRSVRVLELSELEVK